MKFCRLFPNTYLLPPTMISYYFPHGVSYIEGHKTRTESITAHLTPSNPRAGTGVTNMMHTYAEKLGKPGDIGAQILSKTLGGSGYTRANIFPLSPKTDVTPWRRDEAAILTCLQEQCDNGDMPPHPLLYKVTLEYDDYLDTRPTRIYWDSYFIPGNAKLYNVDTLRGANCHGMIENK